MIRGTIQITDTETPKLARIRGEVRNPRALNAAAGKAVEVELKKHFAAKDRQGNRRGWVRSHFWNRRVRSATAFTGATDKGATVEIASAEFELRLRGGTLRAKRAQFLAIPLTNKAKDAGSPREWNDSSALVFIKTKRAAFLMQSEYQPQKGSRVKGQRLTAMYILLKSVKQDADPTALPPPGTLETAIENAAEKYLAREIARNQ